jgi:hypothetical protein
MKKTYKTKGLPYYVKNCNNVYVAAVVLLRNRIGVTENDLEEVDENSIPADATDFEA